MRMIERGIGNACAMGDNTKAKTKIKSHRAVANQQ